MAIKCNICEKELDAFSGGRCKICRSLICPDCMASGGTDTKIGIVCKNCFNEQNSNKNEERNIKNPPESQDAEQIIPDRKRIAGIIIGCFTLLCIFIYLITAPYFTTKKALNIVEFGPSKELQEAKDELAKLSGSYVLKRLEEMATKGNRDTAIRAVYTLGAQPNPKAVLILRQLQASNDCPPYLKSVIVEALLENERLYKAVKE